MLDLFKGKKTTHTRTYVDLIRKVSGNYVNLAPGYAIEVCPLSQILLLSVISRSLQLGDYGIIDRETGEFIKDGNV